MSVNLIIHQSLYFICFAVGVHESAEIPLVFEWKRKVSSV